MSWRTYGIATVLMAILAAPMAWSQRPPQGGRPGQGAGGTPNPLLRIFDSNGDGTLSAEEIEGASAKLKALDTSKDGTLSGDELRPATGPGGGAANRVESGSALDKPPLAKDEQEQKILSTLDATRHGSQRYANVSEADGRLLRQLTEALGARRVVELGTSTGESGLWFSLAHSARPAVISTPTTSIPGGSPSPAGTSSAPASTASSPSSRGTPTRPRGRTPIRSTSCSSTPRKRATTPT